MSNKKILVIDDEQAILDSISAVLGSKGYKVITATDVKGGVDKFRSEKPDMVLCDMMMEQVDAGSKVAHEIRKKDRKLPVYLLSSIGAATAQNVELDRLGFNGVFQKPISPEHMIKTIKKALHMA